jgi:hypothetical protein
LYFQKSEVEITFDGSAFQIKALDYTLSVKKWQMEQVLEVNKNSANIKFKLSSNTANAHIEVILRRVLLKNIFKDFLAEEKKIEEGKKNPKQRLIKAMKTFMGSRK